MPPCTQSFKSSYLTKSSQSHSLTICQPHLITSTGLHEDKTNEGQPNLAYLKTTRTRKSSVFNQISSILYFQHFAFINRSQQKPRYKMLAFSTAEIKTSTRETVFSKSRSYITASPLKLNLSRESKSPALQPLDS